jgi:DNA-binding NarL/FixJ family response regulator
MIKLFIVDDHNLIRMSLGNLLDSMGFEVVGNAENGQDMIARLEGATPQIVLMDYSMPVMNGVAATQWLTENRPDIKTLALSMNSDDLAIIGMIRAGAKGYVLKDAHSSELKEAIRAVAESGFYYSEMIAGKMKDILNYTPEKSSTLLDGITERELEFLHLSCSDYSYKEIAEKMQVSPRTVDGYRESLFLKLEVKSRIGLVIFAIRNKILEL